MKKVMLPAPTMIGDREHTALELLEDLVMVRQAWRIGDGPKHAATVFAAFDKLLESASSGVLILSDKAHQFLSDQALLDQATQISPRAANRFFLRIVRALNDAEDIEEKTPS